MFLKKLFGLHMLISTIFAKPITSRVLYRAKITDVVIDFPIVVLHGLVSSQSKMAPFCDWLETKFNRKVINLEIGNGEKTSLFTPLNEQLAELCQTIYATDELKYGFDFIGISQGGLLARGYVEQCNNFPVRNLITLVSPHGGVFINDYIVNMYSDFNQQHLSLSNYWRDPNNLVHYLLKCSFLPIINNEIIMSEKSRKQKENICNLSNFVMIWSPNDGVVYPAESGKFSFYDKNFNIVPLEKTELYKTDALGLKFLNENGRLFMYKTNCSHEDHRNPICFEQLYGILAKYV
jgi:palmitoyl-protein thioesterase